MESRVLRIQRLASANQPASPPGSRNTYDLAVCPTHGRTEHLSYLGGACCVCHHASLVARGLVKP